jgi:general secretion pathway protein F
MKPCAKTLGIAYTMLIVAGEESGKLEETLSGIVKNIVVQEKVKNDIISKATYPVIIFFLTILVALIFKTFILEVFTSKMMGTGPSVVVIAIKSIIQIAITFGIMGGIIFALYKNKNFTSKLISKLATIEPFKKLIRNYTYSNYFSVLSLAYSAGLPISESLYLSNTVVNLPEATAQLNQVVPRVQQGCELTTALGATMLFSDYAMSQIATGEKAGELEKSLSAVAYDYETQLRVALDVMLKLLEPLMIILVGLIALVVLIFGYNQSNDMFIQNFF